MNEQERAEWLARTIDDILRGSRASKRPAGLEENEIDSLLRVAAARLTKGEEAAHTGIQYEGMIWQRVLQRLDRRTERREGDPAYATTRVVSKGSAEAAPRDAELKELRDIVEMRRKMALRLATFSEAYREDVWRGLQDRVEARDVRKKRWFSFLRRSSKGESTQQADTIDSFLDGLTFPGEAGETEVDGLIAAANNRRRASDVAGTYAENRRQEIWKTISGNISDRETAKTQRTAWPLARRWVLAGAAAALIVAALGPLPATGLAHHPAVGAVNFAGEHLGFVETDNVPAVNAAGETLTPVVSTAEEASEVLGVTVVAPDGVGDFELASSLYFDGRLTATEGGTFVLTYRADSNRSLAVYQELASGADFAGASGSAADVILTDGTPATYFKGSWTPAAGGVSWNSEAAQNIVFERDGVRTTMRYTGPAIERDELVALAGSFH